MQTFTISDLSFTYPTETVPALQNVSLSIEAGSFTVLCGRSGCGKSTLLRQLKPILQPHGTKTGEILFDGKPLDVSFPARAKRPHRLCAAKLRRAAGD